MLSLFLSSLSVEQKAQTCAAVLDFLDARLFSARCKRLPRKMMRENFQQRQTSGLGTHAALHVRLFMTSLAELVKALGRYAGVDIRRVSNEPKPVMSSSFVPCTPSASIWFDVGANDGQFSSALRSSGFAGELVSFEPLGSAHARLTTAAGKDEKWHVHPRCAIGDRAGEIQINVSANSWSSSILPMLALHSEAAAGSSDVGTERAPLCRLDTAASAVSSRRRRRPFLKWTRKAMNGRFLKARPCLCLRLSAFSVSYRWFRFMKGSASGEK